VGVKESVNVTPEAKPVLDIVRQRAGITLDMGRVQDGRHVATAYGAPSAVGIQHLFLEECLTGPGFHLDF
jgi:hypothetical protein